MTLDFLPEDNYHRANVLTFCTFFVCLAVVAVCLIYWTNRELTDAECKLEEAKLIHVREAYELRHGKQW